ncbi:MAG: MFS transporter [Bacteroidota bacterium]|jgi:UMF1 family MFS transporter|nr:MFS transporter [Bacteroidota bacterium]MCA6443551.1 MFS transporter [Bacteroidota bacterium]
MSNLEKNDKKLIRAWTFYDWANSVFPLVITSAIFPVFYETVTAKVADENGLINYYGVNLKNDVIYSFTYSFALLIVVFTAPILSGIADVYGNKKTFLRLFCTLGALSVSTLFFFNPNHLELSMVSLILATIGFWSSLVYYNSYLPEIATEDLQDSVSAKGFSMGYLGSSLLLIICILFINLTKSETFKPVYYCFLMVGAWWFGFAQYTLKILPNNKGKSNQLSGKGVLTNGFQEIKKVLSSLKNYPMLKKFLSSYFFFNMGVQTVMVMAVLFASKEIYWGEGEEASAAKTKTLTLSILLIQFLGIAGSFLFSKLSKKIGNVKALSLAIFIWIFICVFTYVIVRLPFHFYIVAAMVGFVMGGIQALSRSTYSKFLPETNDLTSYFSFYDVMEKLGMIVGTLSFGIISQIFGMRNSVLALIAFFVIGFLLLLRVKQSKSI